MWVKADLHAHCAGDPQHPNIPYAPTELIDRAAALDYKVLALTCHHTVVHTRKLADYAARQGLLLVPGAELRIDDRDVLVYNLPDKTARKLRTFKDLRAWKARDNLVIAPHPYYPDVQPHSLHEKLEQHIKQFDAIEWCHFYTRLVNPFNPRAAAVAARYGLPLVGSSDCHHLWQFHDRTHTLIDLPANPSIDDFVQAVKAGKTRLVTRPLPAHLFLREASWVVRAGIRWLAGRAKLYKPGRP